MYYDRRRPVAVLNYGSYDCLHHGHVRMLWTLRQLGERLVVNVSTDEFHHNVKGKPRAHDSEEARIRALESLGFIDNIGWENSWEQRLSDIARLLAEGYQVLYAVGSDWVGKFDYLNDIDGVTVVYLPRTPGVSSTQKRKEAKKRK